MGICVIKPEESESEPLSSVDLANRTRVVFAGLDVSLQQLGHNSLGQVAGGAPFSYRWGVVERLHIILEQTQINTNYPSVTSFSKTSIAVG